jgi:hypothetical protein
VRALQPRFVNNQGLWSVQYILHRVCSPISSALLIASSAPCFPVLTAAPRFNALNAHDNRRASLAATWILDRTSSFMMPSRLLTREVRAGSMCSDEASVLDMHIMLSLWFLGDLPSNSASSVPPSRRLLHRVCSRVVSAMYTANSATALGFNESRVACVGSPPSTDLLHERHLYCISRNAAAFILTFAPNPRTPMSTRRYGNARPLVKASRFRLE